MASDFILITNNGLVVTEAVQSTNSGGGGSSAFVSMAYTSYPKTKHYATYEEAEAAAKRLAESYGSVSIYQVIAVAERPKPPIIVRMFEKLEKLSRG